MFEIDLSWRSADLALTVAEKAMRAAERALKGGSAPASSPVPGSILSVPDPLSKTQEKMRHLAPYIFFAFYL